MLRGALPDEPRPSQGDIRASGAGTSTSEWLAALPKVELYVHHIGATSLDILAALAARHPEAGVPADAEALAGFYDFTDFAHFLRVYAAVSRLLTTPEDVYLLTIGNLADLAAQHVRYAEVTVTPNGPMSTGVRRVSGCGGVAAQVPCRRGGGVRLWP